MSKARLCPRAAKSMYKVFSKALKLFGLGRVKVNEKNTCVQGRFLSKARRVPGRCILRLGFTPRQPADASAAYPFEDVNSP